MDERGQVTAKSGRYMLDALSFCIGMCAGGAADAICFAPLNKAALRAGGMDHPEELHWYLWILGIDTSQQGRGLGVLLMEPVLARCDLDGIAAYLESSNPRNVPFYERQGFEVRSEFHPEGGPLITGMWRAPS